MFQFSFLPEGSTPRKGGKRRKKFIELYSTVDKLWLRNDRRKVLDSGIIRVCRGKTRVEGVKKINK